MTYYGLVYFTEDSCYNMLLGDYFDMHTKIAYFPFKGLFLPTQTTAKNVVLLPFDTFKNSFN